MARISFLHSVSTRLVQIEAHILQRMRFGFAKLSQKGFSLCRMFPQRSVIRISSAQLIVLIRLVYYDSRITNQICHLNFIIFCLIISTLEQAVRNTSFSCLRYEISQECCRNRRNEKCTCKYANRVNLFNIVYSLVTWIRYTTCGLIISNRKSWDRL